MAGRGTDIMLGGNGEFKAKQQLRFKGYPEEVINEAVGYAQTEDTQEMCIRDRHYIYLYPFISSLLISFLISSNLNYHKKYVNIIP